MNMKKQYTIDGFFKRKQSGSTQDYENPPKIVLDEDTPTPDVPITENRFKKPHLENNEIDLSTLERDPGLRKQIYDYPINQQDTIIRAYINHGPFQQTLSLYPWLKYSKSVDAAFCFPCFLFNKPSGMGHYGQRAFTIDGFHNWKKVGGKNCSFLNHIGTECTSFHNVAQKSCDDLLNEAQNIRNVFEAFTEEERKNNRLRLKATIYTVRLCAFQGIAYIGHDEGLDSIKKRNFHEILKALGVFNIEMEELFRTAPKHALYTSPSIQKKILNLISTRVRRMICEEINGGKFCLVVDEACDQSNKEQMSTVLRFLNKDGFIMERFFGLVHVPDTTSQTLKNAIYSVLSHNNLDLKSILMDFTITIPNPSCIDFRKLRVTNVTPLMVHKHQEQEDEEEKRRRLPKTCGNPRRKLTLIQQIRGQGYDGASNMRGHFKGLQALISNDCPYAYYVHCFAHRLQLTLMAASQGVVALHKFFTRLSFVINVVGASSKRTDQLRDTQAEEIAYKISIDELETGRGLNQIGTLQRAGDTRWSSHLKSVSSLIKMFSPTCEVLLKIIKDGIGPIKGDADSAYEAITTFEFIFVLHLEKEIMEITDLLCQALQRQSQDICNALRLVASTKLLLQKMKDERWDGLLSLERNIDIPDMSSPYFSRGARARNEHSDHTLEHHYRLLRLSTTLDPKSVVEPFRSGDVIKLVEKFYPEDFNEQEKVVLKIQLQHYEIDVVQHVDYKLLTSISELCQWLIKTKRVANFHLIYRVASLILTLPVSTATTERSFSAMNLIKTRLRNKMEDEFLNDSLVLHFERELAEKISLDTIVQDFKNAKDRHIPL
uniref:TTF-type domain-containing protein n=1 Tax=Lactuca sativa TaxID=4236 RepID=A0A9R1XBW9_LACSA|nr:hypothetical protein LSAT_V11C400170440 [Lactuca sativa]